MMKNPVLCKIVLSQYLDGKKYLDERRGVQGNNSMRSREFPRVQPKGTPKTVFSVLPDSSQGTDINQFIKVMKL